MTSDTHFSLEQVIKLSNRPFINPYLMDLELISNWNKTVTMNDTVYHAGDFGDIHTMKDILSCLNFKKLIFVMGNHDRNDTAAIDSIVKSMPEREIDVCPKSCYYDVDSGTSFHVVHEPDGQGSIQACPKTIVLYGHIHGRQLVKQNGIDIGTDAHRYCPISIDTVRFYANALKIYDHSVYCSAATC